MLPTSSPLTTSVPARTLAFTTPRSPMISVSGEAISPWNFPFRSTVPVKVYLPSMSEPSSRKAVSFLRLAVAEGRLQGHMGPLRLRPEAMRLGPRRPGEEARGTFASEHRGLLVAAGVVESDPQESNHPATGRDQLTYR